MSVFIRIVNLWFIITLIIIDSVKLLMASNKKESLADFLKPRKIKHKLGNRKQSL